MAIDKAFSRKKRPKSEREVGVEAIVSRWEKWKKDRKSKEDAWYECQDAFLSRFSSDSEIENYRSQRFIPATYEAVLNVMGQMGRGMFPSEDFFAAIGDNEKAQEHSKTRTLYMRNRVEGSGFIEEYVSKHLFQLLCYGNAPYMLGWQSREERGGEATYTDKLGDSRSYTASSHAYDGPYFKSIDLFNFVIDPYGGEAEGAIKIWRSLVTPEELMSLAEEEDGYAVYDKSQVKKAIEGKESSPEEPSDSDTLQRRQDFGQHDSTRRTDDGFIELLWAYGDIPIDGKLHKNSIVVVANRQYLLRAEKSPYKCGLSPLRMTSLIPIPGLDDMPYGLGIIESALPLQEVINIMTNQVIDGQALAINPMMVAVEDRVQDPENIISTPGGVIWVDDVDRPEHAVSPFYPPMQVFQGYNQVNFHKAEFVDATGSYKNMGAQTHQQTATEVATSASLMASVTGRHIQRAENKDLKNILIFWDEAEKQFFDPTSEVFARYEDGNEYKFEPITEEVIYQSYTWKAMGSGFTHMRDTRIQQLMQWAIMTAQTPAATATDWEEGSRTVLTEMGRRDADKLVPGQQEMFQRAVAEGKIPPQLLQQVLQMVQGGSISSPGSSPPPGMAPGGRGAMPNAGGPAFPGAASGGS